MLFLRSERTLGFMRRLALIAVGAAVATFLLLPAAAAWLRQPAPTPLPDPVNLPRTAHAQQPDARASERRVRSKLLFRSRREEWTVRQQRGPARVGARPVVFAPAPARPASATEPSEDDDDSDDSVHAVGDDLDDEVGDD
jgi:hypothetical protein